MRSTKKVLEVYKMVALPFGASKAVYTFLRVALLLKFIGVKGMLLPWSDFYDFVTLSAFEGSQHTKLTVGALFSLLGWKLTRWT